MVQIGPCIYSAIAKYQRFLFQKWIISLVTISRISINEMRNGNQPSRHFRIVLAIVLIKQLTALHENAANARNALMFAHAFYN